MVYPILRRLKPLAGCLAAETARRKNGPGAGSVPDREVGEVDRSRDRMVLVGPLSR
jgi:hypothetical protein